MQKGQKGVKVVTKLLKGLPVTVIFTKFTTFFTKIYTNYNIKSYEEKSYVRVHGLRGVALCGNCM